MNTFIESLMKEIPVRKDAVIIDGVPMCPICKQELTTPIDILGKTIRVPIACQCMTKRYAEAEARRQMTERERNRDICFSSARKLQTATFETDNLNNGAVTDICKQYVSDFLNADKPFSDGLLFYGDIGTGKSFFSAIICNALIDKGMRCLFTSFIDIGNRLQGTFDKAEVYEEIARPSLVVFDDLGAERSSEFMQEVVYRAIDMRYSCGRPFIVTTNLTGTEMRECNDLMKRRIYNRIIEVCRPVHVIGESQRTKIAKERAER